MTSSDMVEHGPGSGLNASEGASAPEIGSGEPRTPGQAPQGGVQGHDVPRSVSRGGEECADEQWTAALKTVGNAVRNARQASPDDYTPAPSSDEPDAPHANKAPFGARLQAEGKLCPCGFLHIACDPNQGSCKDRALARLRAERDQARRIAVDLENELAAVRDYLRYSDDNGIRTRETVLRILTDPAADEPTQ